MRLDRCNVCLKVGLPGETIEREAYGRTVTINICTTCLKKQQSRNRISQSNSAESRARRISNTRNKHNLVCDYVTQLIADGGYLCHIAIARSLNTDKTAISDNKEAMAMIREELTRRVRRFTRNAFSDKTRCVKYRISDLYTDCNTHSETLFTHLGRKNVQALLVKLGEHSAANQRKHREQAFNARTQELEAIMESMVKTHGVFSKRAFWQVAQTHSESIDARPALKARLDAISEQYQEKLKRDRAERFDRAVGEKLDAIARGESGLKEPFMKCEIAQFVGLSADALRSRGWSDRIDQIALDSMNRVISDRIKAVEDGRCPLPRPYIKKDVIKWLGFHRATIIRHGFNERIDEVIAKSYRDVIKARLDAIEQGVSGLPRPYTQNGCIAWIGLHRDTVKRYGFLDRVDRIVSESKTLVLQLRKEELPTSYPIGA